MRKRDVQAVTWKEGRRYVAQCLDFDVSSFGTSEKKALENLKEALELYLTDTRPSKSTKVTRPSLTSMRLTYA
jgi:predicted RNase H-like HicB family nuclease